jgi:toxin YoeB
MKTYKVAFSDIAWNEHQSFLKTNKKLFDKVNKLIESIIKDPFKGLGKPEPLKYRMSGLWSRRIDDKNRLLYKIVDDQNILIVRCEGHYDKK